MTKNPFVNALAASVYISLIATFFFYGSKLFSPEDTIIAPISMLSLFVFSAAMMGYFFVYQPVRLLIENKPREATAFFLTTVASFAGITLLIVGVLGYFIPI